MAEVDDKAKEAAQRTIDKIAAAHKIKVATEKKVAPRKYKSESKK